MILSLWIWGRKQAGRRALTSVGGLLPFVLLLPFIALAICSVIRSLL